MTQFHEGEGVEVAQPFTIGLRKPGDTINARQWRKAKIVSQLSVTYCGCDICNSGYEVQFPNGTRAVFDAEHIRAIKPTSDDLPSDYECTDGNAG